MEIQKLLAKHQKSKGKGLTTNRWRDQHSDPIESCCTLLRRGKEEKQKEGKENNKKKQKQEAKK